eukprot:TRINITY_DN4430_c0_g2_i1.p1 TRINITY_DN4430_c0_g2~~TRINITY_DN4430_c0_g2_i1.p1  ORF type:complete len:231 (+),score=75.35 TRINITY_DN4430_c0_g2_i1:51-743(+)
MKYEGLGMALGVSVGMLGCIAWKTPEIYDFVIVSMTARWYDEVLTQMEDGEKVCDIGIGTAGALVKNAHTVKAKNLKIVGVDYDCAYIEAAKKAVAAGGIADQCDLHCLSVYDDAVKSRVDEFDSTYFSGSFTLLPDPMAALEVASTITKPDGLIYITQTYQRQYTPLLGAVKPLLRYLITIDFGPLTYESDLDKILTDSKMDVLKNELVPNSVDNKWQCARIIILKPKK